KLLNKSIANTKLYCNISEDLRLFLNSYIHILTLTISIFMKKPYALLVAGLLCASGAMAQSDFERCSAMEVLHNQLKHDPHQEARMNAVEVHTQKFLQARTANQRTNGIVTIPV